MHESVKIEDVLEKLTKPPADPRLINLVNEKRIEIDVLAHLLHKFVRVKQPEEFQFCFVGKGKSKSVIVLLLQSHPEDSLVIKCGGANLIDEERRKFERSPSEDNQALAKGIEDWFRPPLCDHHEYAGHSAIAFQFPSGCKSVQTLREAIRNEQLSKGELIKAFQTFSSAFARWQKLVAGANSFLGSFPWRVRDRERVSQILAAYKEQHQDRVVEPLNDVLDGNCLFWRDKLQKIQCTGGLSHGDLNAHNILIGRDQNGSLNWYVIDFFATSKGAHGPATDWAKLERDLKLRALRDICGNNAKFRDSLRIVDSKLETLAPLPIKKDLIGKCFALVDEVRKQYSRFFETDSSDIPEIEYLYYLLCWTLSYCGTDEFEELGREGDAKTQDAIIESALHIFHILDKKIQQSGSPSHPVLVPDICPRLVVLQKQALFLLSIPILLFIAVLFGMHHIRPVTMSQQALPVRILIAKFDAAPGTTQVNVSGGIASKLSEASPHDEIEIHQSNTVIQLGINSPESIQSLGREYNADAVIWGSYEKVSEATEGTIDIHFTPISKSAVGIRLSKTSSFLPFPAREFSGFTAKEKIGSRMAVLALMVLGWSRAGRGDSVGAIEAFSKAIEQQSVPVDMIDPGLIYQYRAREKNNIYQFKEAINDLNLAIKNGRDSGYVAESIGLRATYWTQLRKRSEVVRDCNSVRDLATAISSAFNYCAAAYMMLGDTRQSAFFANRAIQTSQYTGIKGHLYLRGLYSQLCDYEQANREYNEAIRIDPNDPDIQQQRQFFDQTNQEQSVNPKTPLEYELRINFYRTHGKNDLAREAVAKALQSQPSPRLWTTSAYLHIASGDFKQALADFDRVCQADPLLPLFMLRDLASSICFNKKKKLKKLQISL
jgi:tetratricopeptide (TPR) repeat protein